MFLASCCFVYILKRQGSYHLSSKHKSFKVICLTLQSFTWEIRQYYMNSMILVRPETMVSAYTSVYRWCPVDKRGIQNIYTCRTPVNTKVHVTTSVIRHIKHTWTIYRFISIVWLLLGNGLCKHASVFVECSHIPPWPNIPTDTNVVGFSNVIVLESLSQDV